MENPGLGEGGSGGRILLRFYEMPGSRTTKSASPFCGSATSFNRSISISPPWLLKPSMSSKQRQTQRIVEQTRCLKAAPLSCGPHGARAVGSTQHRHLRGRGVRTSPPSRPGGDARRGTSCHALWLWPRGAGAVSTCNLAAGPSGAATVGLL